MSVSQFERPPTFDVKIVGGKKIIIWNQNNNKKKTPEKSEDLPEPQQSQISTSKPSTESTATVTATATVTVTETKKANQDDRASLEPEPKGQKASNNSELKLNDGNGNEDRNKRESGDVPAVKSKINMDEKEVDDNLPKINSEENSPMKRRSTSPPSLSSSFKILPPIKKELEVTFSV